MVTNYELILTLEEEKKYLPLVRRGLLPVVVMDYKLYYERYKRELRRNIGKMQAIYNTSEEYNKSERTIRNAITFMEAT